MARTGLTQSYAGSVSTLMARPDFLQKPAYHMSVLPIIGRRVHRESSDILLWMQKYYVQLRAVQAYQGYISTAVQ